MRFQEIFSQEKPVIIGMVHCLPLPGTPRFAGNMEQVISQAVADAKTLQQAGCDAVIVENMGDEPFGITLDTEQAVALAVVSAHVKASITIPVGIDAAMNDYRAAISIAKAIGGQFVRIPVFVDTVEFYGGVIKPCAREAMFFRKQLGAEDVAIFADIHVKHTHMVLPHVSIEDSAKAAEGCGADAIIVTGTHIGVETPIEIIERVKKVVKLPVLAASGVKPNNIKQQMAIADGAIVGSSLKSGGILSNPISLELTSQLIQALQEDSRV